MKLILIVFRESLEDDLLRLLDKLRVQAFTEVSKLLGKGETGVAFNSFDWPGTNSMVFTVIEDIRAGEVLEGLKRFRDDLAQHQHGAKVPLRVFTFPCDQII